MNKHLEKLVDQSLNTIRENAGSNPAVSFSGGKDSLVVLDLARKIGIRKAVFCDTTIAFKETLQYVKSIASNYQLDFEIIKAPRSFFELAEKVGFPSRRLRWCCEVFKFAPLSRYVVENNISALITGLRRDESNRRKHYLVTDENPLIPTLQINPILSWTEKDVWNYIKEFRLPPNPLYDEGFNRIGCWLCPFQTAEEWKRVEEVFPEKMRKLRRKLKKTVASSGQLGVRSLDDYVENYGWTSNAHPQVSIICGFLRRASDSVVVEFEKKEYLERVMPLLSILTDQYRISGNMLRLPHAEIVPLKILVEKAVNCVGCGACLSLCRHSALFLDNGKLSVHGERCLRCGECLRTNRLRGACVFRNYAPVRLQLKTLSTYDQKEFDIRYSRICGSQKAGIVRTQISINAIRRHVLELGDVVQLEDSLLVRNASFSAMFRPNNGLLEITVLNKKGKLVDSLWRIRNFLSHTG